MFSRGRGVALESSLAVGDAGLEAAESHGGRLDVEPPESRQERRTKTGQSSRSTIVTKPAGPSSDPREDESACGTPFWHSLSEGRSPHAPAQDIWTHVTTMQHSRNHHTIRHKVLQKGLQGRRGFTKYQAKHGPTQSFNWQRKT